MRVPMLAATRAAAAAAETGSPSSVKTSPDVSMAGAAEIGCFGMNDGAAAPSSPLLSDAFLQACSMWRDQHGPSEAQ